MTAKKPKGPLGAILGAGGTAGGVAAAVWYMATTFATVESVDRLRDQVRDIPDRAEIAELREKVHALDKSIEVLRAVERKKYGGDP